MRDLLLFVVDLGDGPEFRLGNEDDLATMLMHQQYGSGLDLVGVYALGADAVPTSVVYTVTGKYDFDANSWAHPRVVVTMPDGSELVTGYTIDGRA